MIVELSRGHVTLRVGERQVTVKGELLAPPPTVPNFIVYADRLVRWDPPDDSVPIDDATRRQILETLEADMTARGLRIELEN